MNFESFIFWLLCGSLGLIVTLAGFFSRALLAEIKGVRIEMNSLNLTLVKVVSGQEWHAKEIDRLNDRVDRLEREDESDD